MQTKEEKNSEYREELEGITRELVQIADEKVRLRRKIDRTPANHPKLREICGDMDKLLALEKSKEHRKSVLLQLINADD